MKVLLLSFSICIILCIGFSACNGTQKIPAEQPERSFIIGSGGGFTGAYLTYKVHRSGKIEQENSDMETYSFLKTIPPDSVKVCFKILNKLSLEDYVFSHPGNMTFYITINKAGESHQVKWGAADHPIRQDIEDFFERTRTMIGAEYR